MNATDAATAAASFLSLMDTYPTSNTVDAAAQHFAAIAGLQGLTLDELTDAAHDLGYMYL